MRRRQYDSLAFKAGIKTTSMRIVAFLLFGLVMIGTGCRTESVTPPPVQEITWQLGPFEKLDAVNPIMAPEAEGQRFVCPVRNSTVEWEARNVLNPTALVRDGKVHMIYRAQDEHMTSRLGLATSSDGIHFEKLPEPIFYPEEDSLKQYEWPGGVEDPRIVESPDGRYIMTYTAYDGKTARLLLASSPDLENWTKHGLVMGYGKYRDTWSKSGAIVCEMQENGRCVATKIKGKYWMYFGDTNLFVASSEDLISWEVAENAENGKMISVLAPRPGYFDSRLVEPGPFALLTDAGIVLIYNASNAANFNDASLPKFTYAAGQALFDRDNPVKLIDRSEEFFIHPDKDYERVGEVNEVVFVEGMVDFRDSLYLYYGTADRMIAVARGVQQD